MSLRQEKLWYRCCYRCVFLQLLLVAFITVGEIETRLKMYFLLLFLSLSFLVLVSFFFLANMRFFKIIINWFTNFNCWMTEDDVTFDSRGTNRTELRECPDTIFKFCWPLGLGLVFLPNVQPEMIGNKKCCGCLLWQRRHEGDSVIVDWWVGCCSRLLNSRKINR